MRPTEEQVQVALDAWYDTKVAPEWVGWRVDRMREALEAVLELESEEDLEYGLHYITYEPEGSRYPVKERYIPMSLVDAEWYVELQSENPRIAVVEIVQRNKVGAWRKML